MFWKKKYDQIQILGNIYEDSKAQFTRDCVNKDRHNKLLEMSLVFIPLTGQNLRRLNIAKDKCIWHYKTTAMITRTPFEYQWWIYRDDNRYFVIRNDPNSIAELTSEQVKSLGFVVHDE